MNIWGKSVLGSGNSKCEDIEAEMPGAECGRRTPKPVMWPQQRE